MNPQTSIDLAGMGNTLRDCLLLLYKGVTQQEGKISGGSVRYGVSA
jgi:hypothetical protein